MQLDIGGHTTIDNPTDEQIIEALSTMPPGPDAFANLSASGQFGLQTSGSPETGFFTQYCYVEEVDGRLSDYRLTVEATDLQSTVQLFVRFARGEPDWDRDCRFANPPPTSDAMFYYGDSDIPASTEPLDSYAFTVEAEKDVPADPIVGMPYARTFVINRLMILRVLGVLSMLSGWLIILFTPLSRHTTGFGISLVIVSLLLFYFSHRSKAEKKGYNF